MEEEVAYIEETQQDPIPKPKRLKVKDFAAKIKLKYPDYKDVDDLELTNKIIAKYPVYKEHVDFTVEPEKKKVLRGSVDLSASSLNSNVPSNGEDGSEIPTIQLTDEEAGIFDPITQSLKAKDLYNTTKEVSVPSSGKGGQLLTTVPDEDAKSEAAAQRKAVSDKGYDPDKLARDFEGVDYAKYKDDLLEDYKTNPQVYERKLSRIKWKSGLDNELKSAVEQGALAPEEYDNLQFSIQSSLENSNVGDYKQQRGNVNSVANAIKTFGGENKEKLLSEYATEISKVYGNSYKNGFDKAIADTPESKYLTPDAQLGYQYIQDLSPEKAEQYKRLLIDPSTLKDKPDELRGYNHLMQTLEETGLGLMQNAVSEDLNSLKKQAKQNGGLSPEQITEATALEAKNEELSQKRNELDKKYPDRIENKVDDAMQEILGQTISGFNYTGGKAFEAIKNTGKGIWEAVSTPFMSDASNNLRELAIMGETLESNKIYHKTDKNKSVLHDTLVIQPELQTQIDNITNNKMMSEGEKENRLYKLLRENTDKFGRIPIQGGKFNISPSSILYGLSDLGTGLLPFVGIEAMTGGIGGAGAAAKFLRTFTAAAASTFHDEYANAIMEGKTQSDAYKDAMSKTAINSLAMAGAGTPADIRKMAMGMKSSASKIIAQMSDDAIQKVLSKGTPQGLKAFGQSLKQRGKALGENFQEGLKTGAKFEGYMAAANVINDREVDFKHAVLNTFNFGMLGGVVGQIRYKSPTQLQKSNLVRMGEKPEEFRGALEEMKKDGLSQSEYDHRLDLIDKAEKAYKTIPKALADGKPIPQYDKAEYLYNTVIKNEGNAAKSTLPPKQAEKVEMAALVADHKNDLILEPKTEKQLEGRKSSIEKSLEKKDDTGKLELNDKDRKDAEAELEAINQEVATRESFTKTEMKRKDFISEKTKEETADVFVEEPRKVPEEIPLEENRVSVESPQQIPESIPLKDETKTEIPNAETEASFADAEPTKNTPSAEEGTGAFAEGKRTVLSHRGLQEISTEFDLTDVTSRDRKSDPQLFKDAEQTTNKWQNEGKYPENLEALVKKAEDAEVLTDEQRVILQQYIANVRGEIEGMDIKDPNYDKRLQELNRLVRAGEKTRSAAGAALRVPYMGSVPNDLPSMMVEEMRVTKTGELTTGQKETVAKEYDAISKAETAYQQKIEALEAENAKLRAGKKVSETKSTTTKTRKVKEDFIKERKAIAESISEKLKKARQETSAVIVPYAKELIAIAPDVAKLLKSYVEEGVLKLEDITKKIHDELKGYIPDVKEKDVHDIIAGVYNEKKKTKNEISEHIENIRIQAKLVNRLEAVLKGEPTTEKAKIKRNAEIESLRGQIKDIAAFDKEVAASKEAKLSKSVKEGKALDKDLSKAEKEIDTAEAKENKRKEIEAERDRKNQIAEAEKERKQLEREFEKEKRDEERLRIKAAIQKQRELEKELSYRTPEERALDRIKSKMEAEKLELEMRLRTGNYDKTPPKEPIKLDAEALKLRDNLIKLRQNREVRLLLQQRMTEKPKERNMRIAAEVLNIPRTLMTIGDFSGLLRQNIFFSAGHPQKSLRASKEMFKSGWSQQHYDRWFADLKEEPRYQIMQDSRLAISDSLAHDLTKREEDFMSSLSEKIPYLGKTVVKGSERSYTALLNKMRVDMFNYFAKSMEDRGVTYANNPKAYKAMAEYINNATGRSDFGENLNRIAPILNSVFFSPRLIASRVNMLSYWMQPRFWKTLPREVRIDYMRNWISLLGVGGTILGVAALGGADVETDPRSSDFGKIKSGNTRWDVWGGAQPYIRVIAQAAGGARKSTKSGKIYELNGDDIFGETRGGVLLDFFRNKLAPVPGAAVDILSGRTGVGDRIVYQWYGAGDKEIAINKYIHDRLLPMTITGTRDAMQDQGVKALLTAGIPQTFGIGTQTYGNKDSSKEKPKKPTRKEKLKKQD